MKSKLKQNLQAIQDNAVEIWATLAIFVGLPAVAWLYFDFRAALLVFTVASAALGALAVRNNR